MPKAFITGISGQDGSYLAELLLAKGYEVHGMVRRHNLQPQRLAHLLKNREVSGRQLFLHPGEMSEYTSLRRLLCKIQPDELYHLASQTHVGLSFEIPEATCELIALGAVRLLEIVRDLASPPRFFHASSSEIFGQPIHSPQDESTPYAPINPYGCAKALATQMVSIYRHTHGLFACNGILFNHESPRRGENFVTQKICRAAAAIKLGKQTGLLLGDTSAQRDWGHAQDYVHGMWLALQQKEADDFVFATGQLHSVQEVVEIAFEAVGLTWQQFVKHDPRLTRKTEPVRLVGSASKAQQILNWIPKIGFIQLIREMVETELTLGKAPAAASH